jgi:CDP-6-deoxy-D-xylo-4-hexulose-3-dehydrase
LLAISALKIFYNLNDGDEVITSAVNFPTTLNPIIQNNLTPVLVDAEKGSFNIDANQIKKKINSKTKGIVLAHTLGNPFNLNKIKEICEDHNLFLMEDMCDAFGSTYDGKMVGQFGDVSTLSFYPAHHITTGEGGAVLTNKPKLKKIIESLRDWGRDCYCPPGQDNTCKKRYDWQLGGLPHGYDHKYIYSHVGYNLKSTDMQAALGVSQLKKLPEFIKSRKKNFNYLFEAFSEFDDFELPIWEEQSDPSWFGFPISVKSSAKFSRNDLVKYYDENNIGTRLLFAGNIVLQPAYMELNMGKPEEFPVANSVVENTFWLGVYPGLTSEHLDFVIKVTRDFLSKE